MLEKRGREHYVTTSVGASFHVYDAATLRLRFVSGAHEAPIDHMIIVNDVTLVAAGARLYTWHR